MSKYNYGVDMDTENSASVLLKMIAPQSRILEFGAAHGRMTKYMREQLNCTIDIVEIDKKAGLEASKYANLAFIGARHGDIENNIWLKELKDERYDYIIFADVLEHIYTPQKAIRSAEKLLKNNGSILISLPNIAHNSVLVNLYLNQFNYTETGLLDNTHIRFFSLNNLDSIYKEASLALTEFNTINATISNTEQAKFSENEYRNIERLFLDRPWGEVYQFILRLQKSTFAGENEIDLKTIVCGTVEMQMSLYSDNGNGYNESEAQIRTVLMPACIKERFELNGMARSLRFDPIEGAPCRVRILNIETDAEAVEVKAINSAYRDTDNVEYDVFLNTDAGYEITGNFIRATFIQIEAEVDLLNLADYVDDASILIERGICELNDRNEQYAEAQAQLEQVLREASQKEVKIELMQNELVLKEEQTKQIQDELKIREEQIEIIKNELFLKETQISQLGEVLLQTKYNYDCIFQELMVIKNAACWKVTKPIRVTLDWLKKFKVIDLSIKLLKIYKQFGLKGVRDKVKSRFKKLRKRQVKEYCISEKDMIEQQNTKFDKDIKFSILTPLYNTPSQFLIDMINSVLNQTYSNWELCLVDGSDSKHKEVEEICKRFVGQNTKIKYKKLGENLGISANTNVCIDMSSGDYIALLDHDDILHPSALWENARAINETDADVLYSDEDHITESGKHVNPFFKPDWSPDLLYSQMYICHLLVFRTELFRKVGGFRSEYDGSQDYDLMLRFSEETQHICHIPKILYSWRESKASTAANADSKPYAHDAGRRALNEHLKRKYGFAYAEEDLEHVFVYEARFDTMQNNPLVSIIIPMRDKWELSDACVRSILGRSTYSHYEILILDNCSKERETKLWFEEIQKYDTRVRIVDANMEFNWSKLNNFGMKQARGDVYIFLNNDTLVITPDWLERLCENALRDDIGAVGAMLLYEDGAIQHAGVVVGFGGWADHVFKGMMPIHYGAPFVSPIVNRNVMAVTGACVAISKKTIEKIGDFDEEFVICGSDVEFCIRAYESGLNNLYNAHTRLYHLESKSRDSYIPEVDFKKSYECYGPYRNNCDPYYNINLDLNRLHPTEKGETVGIINYINYIKRLPLIKPLYKGMIKTLTNIKDSSETYRIPEIEPVNARRSSVIGENLRLNLLIPSVEKKHVFGGISTALRFFYELTEQMNVDARIITMDNSVNLDLSVPLEGYILTDCKEDIALPKQLIGFADRYGKTIPVGKNDVFVATGWWTAYTFSKVCEWQDQTYGSSKNKLIYLIQDYEPGFYAWSSRYLMAESTYRMNIPTIAVLNSSMLKNYFDACGYRFYKSYFFEPVLNDVLRHHLLENRGTRKRKKQILVYGRPSTQRNAFELIIAALKTWCGIQSDVQEWTLLSLGENHHDVDLGHGMFLHSVGKLSLEEYAETMLESYLGLSFMVSPHPSYPPLEMSTFGMKTITNSYGTKDLSAFNANIICLDNCSQDNIALEMKKLCDCFNEDGQVCINEEYFGNGSMFHEITEGISKELLGD